MRKPSLAPLLLLIVVSFALLFFDRMGILQPIKKPIEGILTPLEAQSFRLSFFLANKIDSFFFAFEKGEKIKKLEEENIKLLSKLSDQERLRQENAILKEQLGVGLPETNRSKILQASVIGRPFDAIILDKGKDDGVSVGDIVIVKNVVVGKISSVSERFSKVALIGSPQNAISAKTVKTRAIGIVRGTSGNIILDNVTLENSLLTDDLVVTAGDFDGEGGGFPEGFVIGKIVSVDKKESSLFQRAKIETPIDIGNLTVVFVVKY